MAFWFERIVTPKRLFFKAALFSIEFSPWEGVDHGDVVHVRVGGEAHAAVVGRDPGVVHAPAPVGLVVRVQGPGVLHRVVVVVPRHRGEGLEVPAAVLGPVGDDQALLGAQGGLILSVGAASDNEESDNGELHFDAHLLTKRRSV